MNSQYIKNVIDPFNQPAVQIPDANKQQSIVKTQLSTDNLTAPSTSSTIMIMNFFNSRRRQIRIYKLSTSGDWEYFGYIPQEEDLRQYFDFIRPISGGMVIKSTTISGTKFTLNGTANAIIKQAVTRLSDLSYKTILSYAKNNTDKIAGVGLSDEVVIVGYPGDFQYSRPLSESQASLDGSDYDQSIVHTSTYPIANVTPVTFSAGATVLIAAVSTDVNNTVVGSFGTYRVRGQLTGAAVAAGSAVVSLQITTQGGSYKNWSPVQTTSLYYFPYTLGGSGTLTTIPFEYFFQTDEIIVDIRVNYDSVSSAGFTLGGTSFTKGSYLAIDQLDYYNYQDKSTAGICIITGADPANVITINGINHYEVIPNSDLSRNLPVAIESPHKEVEMSVASTIIESAPKLGMPMVCTKEQYEHSREIRAVQVLDQDNVVGYASSMGNDLAHLWNTVKPSLKKNLPFVSGLANSFLPGSGHIVNTVGSYLLASDSRAPTHSMGTKSRSLGRGGAFCSDSRSIENILNNMSSMARKPTMTFKKKKEVEEVVEPVIEPVKVAETFTTDRFPDKIFYNLTALNPRKDITAKGSGKKSSDIFVIAAVDPMKTMRSTVVLDAYPLKQFFLNANPQVLMAEAKKGKYLGHADFPVVVSATDEDVVVTSRILLTTTPVVSVNIGEGGTPEEHHAAYSAVSERLKFDSMIRDRPSYVVSYLDNLIQRLTRAGYLAETDTCYLTYIQSDEVAEDLPIEGASYACAAMAISRLYPTEPLYTGTNDDNNLTTHITEKIEDAVTSRRRAIVLGTDTVLDAEDIQEWLDDLPLTENNQYGYSYFEISAQLSGKLKRGLPYNIASINGVIDKMQGGARQVQELCITAGYHQNMLYNEQQALAEFVVKAKKEEAISLEAQSIPLLRDDIDMKVAKWTKDPQFAQEFKVWFDKLLNNVVPGTVTGAKPISWGFAKDVLYHGNAFNNYKAIADHMGMVVGWEPKIVNDKLIVDPLSVQTRYGILKSLDAALGAFPPKSKINAHAEQFKSQLAGKRKVVLKKK